MVKDTISALSNAIVCFKRKKKIDLNAQMSATGHDSEFLGECANNHHHIDISILSGEVTLLYMDMTKIKFDEFRKRDVKLINRLIRYGNLNRDEIIVATGMINFKNNQIK